METFVIRWVAVPLAIACNLALFACVVECPFWACRLLALVCALIVAPQVWELGDDVYFS